jgi:hypothetical protein
VSQLGGVPHAAAARPASKTELKQPAEQDRLVLEVERQACRTEFACIDLSRLVLGNETGTDTEKTGQHGRAPRWQWVDGLVLHAHWSLVTLLTAIRLGDVGEFPMFKGVTIATTFEA